MMAMIVIMCDEEFNDEGDVSGDDVSKKTTSKTRTSKIIKSRRISRASTLLQTSRSPCRDKRHQIAESRKSDDQIMMLCALCLDSETLGNSGPSQWEQTSSSQTERRISTLGHSLEPLGTRLDNPAAQPGLRSTRIMSQVPGVPKRRTNGRAVASPPGPCSRTVRTSPHPPIGLFLEFKKLHSHYPKTKVCSSTVGSVLDIRRAAASSKQLILHDRSSEQTWLRL